MLFQGSESKKIIRIIILKTAITEHVLSVIRNKAKRKCSGNIQKAYVYLLKTSVLRCINITAKSCLVLVFEALCTLRSSKMQSESKKTLNSVA